MINKEKWIELRKTAGPGGKVLPQAALAKAIGVSQQLIGEIESGNVKRTTHINEAAEVFRVHPSELDDEIPPPKDGPVEIRVPEAYPSQNLVYSQQRKLKDLPVYASARGGDGEIIITFSPIDWIERPEQLSSVKEAYAMYIVGDSMSPRFDQGDTVWVHPHLPPKQGDDVIIFRGGVQDVAAMVKKFVKQTGDSWTVRQFNPAKQFSLNRKEWPHCHVILGNSYSRR